MRRVRLATIYSRFLFAVYAPNNTSHDCTNMPAALIISLLLCAFATRTVLAQATCKPVNGANKYCACSLVDGDGTAAGVVDLSLYGNRDRSYR